MRNFGSETHERLRVTDENHSPACAAALIVFVALAVEAVAQSEHARKIAATFAGTEYDKYANDILIGKPDYIVFTPMPRK